MEVICLSNQKALKRADEQSNLPETFKATNGLLAQMVQSVKQILSSPGFIKISFADLCSVLQGTHAESFFAAAEATGETAHGKSLTNYSSIRFWKADEFSATQTRCWSVSSEVTI